MRLQSMTQIDPNILQAISWGDPATTASSLLMKVRRYMIGCESSERLRCIDALMNPLESLQKNGTSHIPVTNKTSTQSLIQVPHQVYWLLCKIGNRFVNAMIVQFLYKYWTVFMYLSIPSEAAHPPS